MENSPTSPEETLFFCFGPPKSGTTYLQRMLNSHPDVSCPSEHQFDFLREGFISLLKNYNNGLQLIDKRTGGQNATLVNTDTLSLIFSNSVELILKASADGKPVIGANDNAILNNLEFYNSLFKSPKMLAIFRNPINTGISSWHHNLRLGEEEHPKHRELAMQFGGFEGWLKQSANWFNEAVDRYRLFAKTNNNTMFVRYEDLTKNTPEQLVRIFSFLGARVDEKIIENIAASSSLEAMREKSAHPGFFRQGSTDFGKDEIDDKLRRELTLMTSQSLNYLGYELQHQSG